VIVTDWLDGVPLSSTIASGSRPERDLAALRYLEFLLAGPARAGLLHADPHPGNFRLLPDGRFGVLDFGAVKRWPTGCGRRRAAAHPGAVRRRGRVVAGLREAGFIKASVQLDPAALLATSPRSWPRRGTRPGVLPGLAARAVPAPQRPAAAAVGDRAEAQPAAGVPADPPGLAGRDRRAVPDRREVPVLDVLADWLPGFDVEALPYVDIVEPDRGPGEPTADPVDENGDPVGHPVRTGYSDRARRRGVRPGAGLQAGLDVAQVGSGAGLARPRLVAGLDRHRPGEQRRPEGRQAAAPAQALRWLIPSGYEHSLLLALQLVNESVTWRPFGLAEHGQHPEAHTPRLRDQFGRETTGPSRRAGHPHCTSGPSRGWREGDGRLPRGRPSSPGALGSRRMDSSQGSF